MVPVTMPRSGILLAVSLVALVLVAVALVRSGANASHAPGAVSLLYIDTDTTGNAATTLGTVEECGSISGIGTLLDVDIAIADWPANGDGLAGFQMLLNYDPAVVRVSDWDGHLLLADKVFSQPVPFFGESDSDGTLALWMADLPVSVLPPATDESSAGVLARVTLESVGAGQTTLSITSPSAYLFPDVSAGSHVPVTQINNAFVAVNQGCVPGPQPGPTPPLVPPESCSDTEDSDGDDFSDCVENFIGTHPLISCAADTTRNNEPEPDRWPLDYDDDQRSSSLDVAQYFKFFSDSPPAYDARRDLSTDGVVSLSDLLHHRQYFGVNCTTPLDADGDGQPDSVDACPTIATTWTTPLGDADCDSFLDSIETFVGTDPNDACADTAAANDEADDRWPTDNNDNQTTNTLDVAFYVGNLNSQPVPGGPPYLVRLDLNTNGIVNTLDVAKFIPLLNEVCTALP